ncbi:MAG: type I DNA topoisomerase [Patescibacteria group bacterium]|nr:type I DNA topoisomerase [bacterium]MDZ4240760.1 type I DNA topoisomerase [Patescibacteria group bacterium]
MKKLLIVESPAKAKTISKYLDDSFKVTASVGHVRDLPKSAKKAIDIENGFIPHYEIPHGKEKIIQEIKALAKKSDEVYLATDPDREGEAIAWHVKEAAGLKNPKRIVFHEITREAVEDALKHPRPIDMNLKEAQEARRVLDRLVGYDLSGLIWKKVRYGLSAGRVQSPALRILAEREREIRAFQPHTYWILYADVTTQKGQAFTLTCAEEPTDKKETERILEVGKKSAWMVADIKETEVKRPARAPFITSTLQQAASSRLGLAPSRTMSLAQKLYEAGLITYMRTDSTALSTSAQSQIAATIKEKYGENYHLSQTYKTTSKNAQEAHEAIRPTNFSKEIAGGNDAEKAVYRLIWQRAVASQMKPAVMLRTKISVAIENIPEFATTGSHITFDGWFKADTRARGEEVELPKVSKGENLSLTEMRNEQKETLPPFRYSEAGLVKELEKRGIGRPSTYASTIKTLIDRGYTTKEGRMLKPTDTGEVVSEFLEKNFAHYISDTFTAEMEDQLDSIAKGESEYEKTLKTFYRPFSKEVKEKSKNSEKITTLGEADKSMRCPVCGSAMVIKLGRGGKFLSCEKFPDCKGARTMDGSVVEAAKETGEICPDCQKGKLVEREGKYGRFIACSRYPKCRFIKDDPNQVRPTTGIKCPTCKEGEMMERRGRFGAFYSCSNYPRCKYAIKAKPTGTTCPLCSSLMMEGTKTIPERCSDKNCPNHNPHKLAEKTG